MAEQEVELSLRFEILYAYAQAVHLLREGDEKALVQSNLLNDDLPG